MFLLFSSFLSIYRASFSTIEGIIHRPSVRGFGADLCSCLSALCVFSIMTHFPFSVISILCIKLKENKTEVGRARESGNLQTDKRRRYAGEPRGPRHALIASLKT